MSLSEIIKLTRKKAYLSQEEFASEINVSVATINRWENNKTQPNNTAMKNIRIFCSKHELPFDELEREWLNQSLEGQK